MEEYAVEQSTAPKPKVAQAPAAGSTGKPTPYSAPSDNKCATFGGCAVPISASQLYPETAPAQEPRAKDARELSRRHVPRMEAARGQRELGRATPT